MTAAERKRGLRAAVDAKVHSYSPDFRMLYPDQMAMLWEVIDSLVDECAGGHPLESAAILIEQHMSTMPLEKRVCDHCGRATYKSTAEFNEYKALEETVKKLRRFAAMKG